MKKIYLVPLMDQIIPAILTLFLLGGVIILCVAGVRSLNNSSSNIYYRLQRGDIEYKVKEIEKSSELLNRLEVLKQTENSSPVLVKMIEKLEREITIELEKGLGVQEHGNTHTEQTEP